MKIWNNIEVAKALEVEINFKFDATSVTTDSRSIKGGELFIALKGDNFDGNKFIEDAIKKGAVAAICDDKEIAAKIKKTILVEDGLKALTKLAKYRRKNCFAKIIAITGSVGKTTTKELVRDILAENHKVHSTIGNLNNHIGLPLTLVNMPLDSDVAVLEMGMNHEGEIYHLSSIAKPDIAAISWVAENHIENLGSLENIAKAKAEIFDWLKRSGSAIIPADNDQFSTLSEILENSDITNIASFGLEQNNVYEEDDDYGFNIEDDEFLIDKKICDELVLNNILCALTICKEAGARISAAGKVISKFKPVKGRGERLKLKNGAEIIDDSYNASPTSMKKALANLAKEKAKRKIAVLGNMLELGENTKKYHEELAEHITGIEEVYCVGSHMEHLSKKLPKTLKSKYFPEYNAALSEIKNEAKKGDLILVKGSHGSNLWKLVDALRNL